MRRFTPFWSFDCTENTPSPCKVDEGNETVCAPVWLLTVLFRYKRSCIFLAWIPWEDDGGGEREREKTCTRKIPKALSWQSGPGCRVFYTDVFKFVLNAFLRLTISPVPLAAFRCADLDGLTAKAPRRKSRVGERHFHHTAAEGGSRWRVSLDRGKFKFYRWKPPKKNYFQMEKLQQRRWDVLLLNFHVLVDDIAKLDLFGCTIRGISIAKPLWLLFERGRERERVVQVADSCCIIFVPGSEA